MTTRHAAVTAAAEPRGPSATDDRTRTTNPAGPTPGPPADTPTSGAHRTMDPTTTTDPRRTTHASPPPHRRRATHHRSRLAVLATVAALVAAACSDADTDTADAPTVTVEEGAAGTGGATTDTAAASPDSSSPDVTSATDAGGGDDTAVADSVEATAPSGGTATSGDGGTVTLVTYESFPTEGTDLNASLAEFTEATGIDVEILVAGDAGTMLSKAELTAGNPEGDVMWGIDNSLISRAIDSGVFEPYVADGLDAVPSRFVDLVPEGEATPVDFGDVCVNYDIAALDEAGIEPPSSLDDLADPAYADLLVVQDPASSSPGLAFLLATVDEYGVDGWQDYWSRLRDNGVEVVDGWTQAYYDRFSYAGGDRPLVVSYGSSPPFEVVFAEEELDAAPTGVVESTCYRQVEFAGVLAGTDRPDEARRLVDHLISTSFQATLPLDVFVFPVNEGVELDPVFVEFAVIPDSSRGLDPAEVDANRETWIDEWTDLVVG
ncbi:thiamine ABC transporter substrate-binding protein [Ilumatobacter sp.]|uniref:thiamine ABC transporter substrate-binding protein n=1 Tax=Ilumatobacter sp. TaxID=1967498 RepID=UPI003B523BD1